MIFQPRTKFVLAGGFAALLALMAVLTVMGVGVLTALYEDIEAERLSSEKIQKVHIMREAIRRRSFSMLYVQTLTDFFDRDEERLRFNGFAGDFIVARDGYLEFGVTAEERAILDRLRKALRATQAFVEETMRLAVEGENREMIEAATLEAVRNQRPLLDTLNELVAYQVRTSAMRSAHIKESQKDILAVAVFAAVAILGLSILISLYAYRREVYQTNQLVREIAERKQAEDAALEAQARLSGILQIAPDAVISVGGDMNIQLFNQGAERIFGYTAGQVLGQPLEILMPEYFRKNHRRLVEEFGRSDESYRLMDRRQDVLGLRKDGTEFPASASVTKLDIHGEKIFTVMLQDITERKRAEESLMEAKEGAETASRSKSEFLAAMSHDLRTPLNAILGFAEIISRQHLGPIADKYREYAEDIHSSGELLLSLVDDILDLSAIEAGKQSLNKENISITDVVAECEVLVKEKARFQGIELTTKVPEDLPLLYADRRAIKQILINLLSNAIKFTPEGNGIELKATAVDDHHIFEVSDTGSGIPADKLATITDPFVRGETDPHKNREGTGLGLTIVKSLVDLHDGELDIKSAVDKGTTVTVSIPTTIRRDENVPEQSPTSA